MAPLTEREMISPGHGLTSSSAVLLSFSHRSAAWSTVKVRIGLGQNAVNAPPQIRLHLINRDDDGYLRHSEFLPFL